MKQRIGDDEIERLPGQRLERCMRQDGDLVVAGESLAQSVLHPRRRIEEVEAAAFGCHKIGGERVAAAMVEHDRRGRPTSSTMPLAMAW